MFLRRAISEKWEHPTQGIVFEKELCGKIQEKIRLNNPWFA